MKVKRIFLDNYKLCKKDEADLIIVPAKGDSEVNAPELYYKRIEPYWIVKEVSDEIVWTSDTKISISVDQDKYNELVDWWFDNIDDSFKEYLLRLSDKAIEVGFDVSLSISKARNKLKTLEQNKRKSNLGKFLVQWITVGCSRFVHKQRSNSIYS